MYTVVGVILELSMGLLHTYAVLAQESQAILMMASHRMDSFRSCGHCSVLPGSNTGICEHDGGSSVSHSYILCPGTDLFIRLSLQFGLHRTSR